jgi:hypothetical protein
VIPWALIMRAIDGGFAVAQAVDRAIPVVKRIIRRVKGDPPVATGPGLSYKDVQHQQAQMRAGARPPEPDAHPSVLPVRPRTPPGER